MRLVPAMICLSLLIVSSSRAATPDEKFAAAREALDRGAYAANPAAMIEARSVIEQLVTRNPKSAPLHYWLAYADWRIAPRVMEKKAQATRFVKDGLQHADRALELEPKLAEAVALKASLLGLSLQLEPATMMTVGPEIQATMDRALTMAPDNPRVVLLDAMGTLHKPAFVGGGPERALEKFVKAQALFDREGDAVPPSAYTPRWGRFESLAWAGRSAAKMNDRAAARAFYEKALALRPDSGWVRLVLLPELDRADSAATASKKGQS